ncbi:hypothetical protein K491DRAFT_761230 [Lophiostoma macrostomum CBS 122681]|uniref:Uncharacterized protein n=1 Tax=Lophiostoma macrostomum CBS 122681 TaxID=1314788 RepID=A0A6A6STV5_9PLEO|nr:hypothetical protein K491DRAFT_761230 [Lophiostoma macrostomum CBS 122681]
MSDSDLAEFMPDVPEKALHLKIEEERVFLDLALDKDELREFAIIADNEKLQDDLNRCNRVLDSGDVTVDKIKVGGKAVRTAAKLVAGQEKLKNVRAEKKKHEKAWDVLLNKDKLVGMYESALKEPYCIGIGHWDQVASGVDFIALFGPHYPEKDWPEEVPYCHMVYLARYLDQCKKNQGDTDGSRVRGAACQVCGGPFVGLYHTHGNRVIDSEGDGVLKVEEST